jgi:hypothetical protein
MNHVHHLVVAALLSLIACSDGTDPADPAIGMYDQVQVSGQAPRTAACGPFTVVDGLITIEADDTFLKVDVHSTPGGSSTCGYIGGTWVRVNANTLELTPDPAAFPGFGPQEATVEGDQLTFTPTGQVYTRRE